MTVDEALILINKLDAGLATIAFQGLSIPSQIAVDLRKLIKETVGKP